MNIFSSHWRPGQLAAVFLAASAVFVCVGEASAQDVEVVVGGLDGRDLGPRDADDLSDALRDLRGVRVVDAIDFEREARSMRVDDLVPQNAGALTDLCRALRVNAVIYGISDVPNRDNWPRARRNDRVLFLSIYSGATGEFIDERVVRVEGGQYNRRIWRDAVQSIESLLFEAGRNRSDGGRNDDGGGRDQYDDGNVRDRYDSRDDTDRRKDNFDDRGDGYDDRYDNRDDDYGGRKRGGGSTLFQVYAGANFMRRDFDYAAAVGGPFSENGIKYASSLAPGLAVEGELFPLARSGGSVEGLGIGARFEKVFLETTQTVIEPVMPGMEGVGQQAPEETVLTTEHSHLLLRALYRHRFSGGQEFIGHAGVGFLTFAIAANDEYNGVEYTYLDIGARAVVPLSSPAASLDFRLAFMPSVSLGKTVTEVGGAASTYGYRAYGGLLSVLRSGLSLRAGAEYSAYESDITGVGRSLRKGISASDGYFALRIMAGYRL